MSLLSPEVVDRLLEALCTDDVFRAAFERDARAALRSLGHETPAADFGIEGRDPVLPFLDLKGGLASKEAIAADRERLARTYKEDRAAGKRGAIFNHFECCAHRD